MSRKDWGGLAATSGASGQTERQLQTAEGRAARRQALLNLADFYRRKGDEREARNYERQAGAIPA